MKRYAHTLEGCTKDDWQLLEEHLCGVSELTKRFAAQFNAEHWGELVGLWHDLGKGSDDFQRYLEQSGDPSCSPRVDHSTAGAQHAVSAGGLLGYVLAYAIAGHHGGLPDGRSEDSCLEKRLSKNVPSWNIVDGTLQNVDLSKTLPTILRAAFESRGGQQGAFSAAFFTRMLFSCLVDADFLDTESFMSPERHESRSEWPKDILDRMSKCLDDHLASFGPPRTLVNEQRAKVLDDCRRAAEMEPGLFSLTVPTGGGKTLSSLAFALDHARRHGMRRVVYVIPFTSIIEQNADVFREVMEPLATSLGEEPVIEHHSNLDVGEETISSRLATENWDAPLVVTTSVQFYESLFANRTSKCRKLHNIARSVIILDEAQTLPVSYLEPCMAALRELTMNYGSSVVLCTATQPAIEKREKFDKGLENIREIISNRGELYRSLRRVEIEKIGQQEDLELAKRMLDEDRVLCVVNTRSHARKLFDLLGERAGHFHLSTLMVPEHRSAVLREIRERLNSGADCRVVSTQLVEAGVDLDFPVVMRSMAGVDSIAQAAGRCNRNGKLSELGRAVVFKSEHKRAERFFAETSGCGAQVLECHKDPLSLEAVEQYFSLYYWGRPSLDEKDIMGKFRLDRSNQSLPFDFSFKRAARDFELIEDNGTSVIVPWGDRGHKLCELLHCNAAEPDRYLLRKLQRYSVRLHDNEWKRALSLGAVEIVGERFPVLVSPELHYSERTGLNLEGGKPSSLIV